jgi:hypothetical protein
MICNRADVGTPVTDTPGWSMPSPLPRRSGNGRRYLRAPPSNRLESSKASEEDNTRSGSTISGGCVSAGLTPARKMLRSWTITEGDDGDGRPRRLARCCWRSSSGRWARPRRSWRTGSGFRMCGWTRSSTAGAASPPRRRCGWLRLGTSPQFWLNGQLALDLYRASHDEEELRELERIEPVSH